LKIPAALLGPKRQSACIVLTNEMSQYLEIFHNRPAIFSI
jgi:hypothetical protein